LSVNNVVEIDNLWVRYRSSENWVLRNVNLSIKQGYAVLIVGRSGSGKTTLVRTLTGAVKHIYGAEVRGSIKILGREIENYDIEELRRVIQIVNQNPYADFFNIYIEDDILSIIKSSNVDYEYVNKILDMFKVRDLTNRYLFELSGGQLKRLAMVKALLFNPSIVVLDEPLMWLDDIGVDSVVEALKILKRLGKTVIVLEHRFKPLLDFVDEVYVIKNGSLEPIDRSSLYPSKSHSYIYNNESKVVKGSREKVAEVKDIWFRYDNEWILKGVDFSIYEGDIVVIYGSNGSGKSTLLKILAGYLKPRKGFVKIYRRSIYIPQNVYLFYTEETLENEVKALCSLRKGGGECVEIVKNRVVNDLGLLNLDFSRTPFSLSWGEAVRFAVSLIHSLDPKTIVLLDEPFTGLTYYERFLLAEYLLKIGCTIVVATSNRDVVSFMYTRGRDLRTLLLSNGRLEDVKMGIDLEVFDLGYKVKELLYGDNH
jgi:energy-coupling factor transport system ATP-binding protein